MKRAKRQELIDTAIDLFAEHGISNVSVVMIAKKLGASRSTVYHHFKNGKEAIIAEILQIFEACVSQNVPNEKAWNSKDADVEKILFSLFFEFPIMDVLRLRKITRIIVSEMYFNKQIAKHAITHFITGREKMLADCFASLANAGKIPPIDAESTARCLNRLIVTYAIEDALCYPFIHDEAKLDE